MLLLLLIVVPSLLVTVLVTTVLADGVNDFERKRLNVSQLQQQHLSIINQSVSHYFENSVANRCLPWSMVAKHYMDRSMDIGPDLVPFPGCR